MPNDVGDPANAVMPVDRGLIQERLEKYPSLSEVLGGAQWLQDCLSATSEWQQMHPVIRWLDSSDNHVFLPRLDFCLQRVVSFANWQTSKGGYKELVRHLQSNTRDFFTALPKLYLTAYLLERGHNVEWPPTGPDIEIDGQIRLEVTSLQKADWASTLRNVLHAVPNRECYDIQMNMPEMIELNENEVARIEGFVRATCRPTQLLNGEAQVIGEIVATDLRQRPPRQTGTVQVLYPGSGSILNTRPSLQSTESFIDMLWASLHHKIKQFARFQLNGAIIIQIDSTDPAIYSFVQHDLDNREVEMDVWTDIPECIECVWLYSLDFESLGPRQLRFSANPKCSAQTVEKYDFLRQTLFDRHRFASEFIGPLSPFLSFDEELTSYYRERDLRKRNDEIRPLLGD